MSNQIQEPLLAGINDSMANMDSAENIHKEDSNVSELVEIKKADPDSKKLDDIKRNLVFENPKELKGKKKEDGYLGAMPEENDVLSRQQINQCFMDIEDNHPLRQRAKCEHIVPCCTKCWKPLGCCKKPETKLDQSKNVIQIDDFKMAMRSTLLHKINPKLKIPKSERQSVNDPYIVLGYGINAYFDIIFNLMMCMIICSIAFFPVMVLNAHNPIQQLQYEGKYFINMFSLGNMGGSDVACYQKTIEKGVIGLKCPTGTYIDTDHVIFGVMSQFIDQSDYCTNDAISKAIKNKKENAKLTICSNYLDYESMNKTIKSKCIGKNSNSCDLDLELQNLYQTPLTVEAKSKIQGPTNKAPCNEKATFFIQSPCLIPKKYTIDRFIYGLFCGSVAVFVYLFTMLYIDYIKCVQVNNYIDWDVKTITAGDYSMEFDLEPKTYKRWQDHYYDDNNPISENAQFKIFIQEEFEDRINKIDDQGYDDENKRNYKKKIAKVTFAFNNAEIISALKERGEQIKTEKWDKLAEINEEITQKLKDQELLDQLQTPCSVFVTWETEEAIQRALSWSENNEKPQMSILGEEIDVQGASEPTDIIWENRHFLPAQRTKKRVCVGIVVGIMLLCSGVAIYIFTMMSIAAKERYPAVNCADVNDLYKNRMDTWETKAYSSYTRNLKQLKKTPPGKTDFGGSLQCYCQKIKKDYPKGWQRSIKHKSNDVKIKTMCQFYFQDVTSAMLIGYSISFLIIAINLILKKVIINLITWVGEDTLSEQISSITNGVFYALFFNTGILITLVNANLSEHQPKLLTQYTNQGLYYDFSPAWYQNVGEKIVQTMLIQALLPYSALMIGFIKPWIKRMIDRKFGKDIYVTKKTSMQAYKDLWFGEDYVIHFKCSGVINVVWVTMLYGFGLPILFPIAALNFFNQYICERITAAYQVRLPPALDDRLINFVLGKLKWAPLIFLMNGYWMLSNQEIFLNKWEFKNKISEHMKSQHFIEFNVNWALSIEIMLFAAFVIICIKVFVPAKYLDLWGFGMENIKIEVDEDLPNFFSVVRFTAADEVLLEETNCQKNFGFMINDPDTIDSLKNIIMPKKACQGTPWYQMLSNPKYRNEFNYIGAFVQEREKLIEDGQEDFEDDEGEIIPEQHALREEQSDMVMILLNLAVLPDEVVKQIDFLPGWSRRFKKLMDQYKLDWNAKQYIEEETQVDGSDGKITEKKTVRNPDFWKWDYQNEDLEKAYLRFIVKQQETDQDLHEDTIKFQNDMIEINKKKTEKVAYVSDVAPCYDEKESDSDFYEGGKDNHYFKQD